MDLAFNIGPERWIGGPGMSVYYAVSWVCHCAVGRERPGTEDLVVVDRVCVTDVWGHVEPGRQCTLTRGAKGVMWCSRVG